MSLSVVIPTFNELKNGFLPDICQTLSSNELNGLEVICVDSFSTDGTRELIEKYGFTLVDCETNSRAKRLNQGIKAAKNDFILLHHPRSILSLEGLSFLMKNKANFKWGGFTHCFDHHHPLLRFTSWYSNEVRGKKKGILYLDHCIFFHRHLLNNDPPILEVDIFEDTELSLKLKETSLPIILPYMSMTSAIRFKKNGVWFQAILNQILKLGYLLNVPDKIMNIIYEKGLSLNSKYRN